MKPAPMQDRLLDAAARLFAEQGFDATSVQEIVERAEVTKGALYHYFDSKQDLLYEIYHAIISTQLAGLDAITDRGLPPADTLRALIRDLTVSTAERSDWALVFGRESHRLDAGRQALVRADRRRYHDTVRDLVAAAQAAGTFASAASPDVVTFTLFGVINQLPRWYDPHGPKTAEQLGDEIADLILAGLRPA